MKSYKNHTFVICAYKESPYLEKAVRSVCRQTVRSRRLIVTGTPNDHIYAIAKKYNVPVKVNTADDCTTMVGNWNFGMSCAKTEYVTIVHQDDYMEPRYLEEVIRKSRGMKPIIIFTAYFEDRGGKRVYHNKLLRIKDIMNTGFAMFPGSKWARRLVLSIGDPICCPAVTFAKSRCGDFKFDPDFKNCCDWDAWERLSLRDGDFVYVNKPLMAHRIHEGSGTTRDLANGVRASEEIKIYKRFWPDPIVKLLMKYYVKAADSNETE